MIRSILVPLDGSQFGEQALPWALSLAKTAQGSVQLVHVHRPLEVTYAEMQIFDDTLDNQLRERERIYLETMVKKLIPAGVPVTAVNRDGDIAVALREHAVEHNASLIVMTTHARGAMGRFWLGSVADELMREAPVPLLLVHPHEKAGALTEPRAIKHVLIPLDGEPLGEQILGPALAVGKLYGAEFTLLRVIRPLQPMSLPVGVGSYGEVAHHMLQRIEELHDQLRREANNYLDGVAARLRAEGVKVITRVVVEEQPGVAILQHAQAPIDLIAMQTHGRRGLSRLFVGSVADKVIRGAQVPVLVQRPK
jgi:nucleotide-binding universal stress UspA family protein